MDGPFPRLLMEDHCEAYPLWKEAGLHGLPCVHVDAHLDVSDDGFTPESLRHIASCRTREELERWRGSDFLPWGGFHCGNFLYPALLEGLVEHLVWVVPPHLPGGDPLAWLRRELQGWVEPTFREYGSLHLEEGRVEGVLAGRRLTVCTAERLPPLRGPVLLDLDVDYFLDAEDRVWQTPGELRRQLGDLEPAALTVAWSVNGGYTPLEHRYLGQVAFRLFGEGDERLGPLVQRIVEADHRRGGYPEPPPDAPGWLRAALALKAGLAAGEGPEGPAAREAARLDPGHRLEPINHGALLFRRRDYGEAVRWLDRAAREHPGEAPLCRYMQGLAEVKAGRPEAGLALWEPLLEEPRLGAQELGYVAFMRGKVLADLGRAAEALESFRAALEREPDNAVYLHYSGLAWKALGHREEAARELRRSLRLAPERLGSVETRLALAEVYEAQGRKALAQAEHRKVRDLDVTGVFAIKSWLAGP